MTSSTTFKNFCALVLTGLLLGCSSSAFGQGRPSANEAGKDWKSQLGFGLMVKPKYEGSSDYDYWPIPYFEFEYKNSLYISPYRGVGYKQESDSGFSYDLGLGFDFGRDEEDGDLLIGMGDVDFSGELRAGIAYDFGPVEFGLAASKAVTGAHDGYEVDFRLGRTFVLREIRSVFRLGAYATYSSEDYLQTYFGVDPIQSVRSGHQQFSLESGIKEVGVSTMFIRQLNREWSLLFLANYGKFVGDVPDSPVVESSNRFFGGLFTVRSF